MRCYLFILALMFGLGTGAFAQETAKPAGYVINGKINGDYKGKVYLVREESLHGEQTVIDSTEVVDGTYHFEGDSVEVVMLHFIRSNDGQITPLFLENGEITIVGDAKLFLHATVSGNGGGLEDIRPRRAEGAGGICAPEQAHQRQLAPHPGRDGEEVQ